VPAGTCATGLTAVGGTAVGVGAAAANKRPKGPGASVRPALTRSRRLQPEAGGLSRIIFTFCDTC